MIVVTITTKEYVEDMEATFVIELFRLIFKDYKVSSGQVNFFIDKEISETTIEISGKPDNVEQGVWESECEKYFFGRIVTFKN